MEQFFYKIRLNTGRVIGPLEFERIKLFIASGTITGLEMARLYPTGDWKDINSYPEIAELLLQKLEGRLVVDEMKTGDEPPNDHSSVNEVTTPSLNRDPALPPASPDTGQSDLPPSHPSSISMALEDPGTGTNNEATVVLAKEGQEQDDERTVIYNSDDNKNSSSSEIKLEVDSEIRPKLEEPSNQPLEILKENQVAITADPRIANEKTAFLSMSPKEKKRSAAAQHKKKIGILLAIAAVAAFLILGDEEKKVSDSDQVFRVEMPVNLPFDAQKSEKTFFEGIKAYSEDTVEGYKKAAKLFLKAASMDPNNVRSICLLASSYMNLIDVLPRDENYFNVVTRLIELERAKGVDLAETVIADVELYHILGNADAALNRIIEYSKTHPQFGIEMFYYLALSFYYKFQYPEALKYLNNIDPKNFFSPKIPYLYGMIYEKNQQIDEAIKAYQDTIARSPKHVKARVRLAELYFHKDNLPESGKHADFVIQHANLASKAELSKSYYFRSRLHLIGAREPDALADLEQALKNNPEDQDVLLELYTLKAKMGGKVKDAQTKAKMFYFLAQGEKAFKEGNLHEAVTFFISARDVQGDDPTPLLRIAEVFRKKGDLQSAKANLAKAVKTAPKREDIYPKYIRTLIDAYEFEEASRILTIYKELNPAVSVVDRLQGDLFFRQDRLHEANAYYKRALSTTNSDTSIYLAYASLMFKGNNFRDAAFYYGLAQRFDPYNVEAIVGIGKSLAEIESLAKGVEYVQGMLAISPYKPALINGIAEIYQRKGDYTSALKFAENALATDASFSLAHKTRGDAYYSQDKVKEALDAYLTYTNLAPLDPAGHIERYKIFLKKMDLKAAKEAIQKVIDNYPKYPGVYYMLGDLYREGQNFRSALDAAQEEIKNNPGYVPAYVLAGQALNMGKDHANALALLNKALKMSPNYVPALIQAGVANHMLKAYAAAQAMLERALSLDSGNPEVHKRLGTLFYDLGKRDEARQHFKAYLDLYPNAPDRSDIEVLAK